MSRPPSGDQFEISHGDQRAVVVEVGGAIREYTWARRAVLEAFPVDAMCDGAHGTPLIPWPNRLADGAYRFDGHDHQVPLTEPKKHNAIHGLLRWRPWRAHGHAADRVVMAATIFPMSGYPFLLDVEVAYELSDQGLTVTTTATNNGDTALPFGHGQHPYLSPGQGLIDDCTLTLEAATRIVVDDDRQLPTGTEPVEGTAYDFRGGRRIGDQAVDYPFTDLTRDSDGRAWMRLSAPDGKTAELWVDGNYPILEVFTGDTLAPDRRRKGLGAEPMTCPPNAFQSGEGVIRLEPGQAYVGAWGARLS